MKMETLKKMSKNYSKSKIFLMISLLLFVSLLSFNVYANDNKLPPLTEEQKKELDEKIQEEIEDVKNDKDLTDTEKENLIKDISACGANGRVWKSGWFSSSLSGYCGDRANLTFWDYGFNQDAYRRTSCEEDGGEYKNISVGDTAQPKYRCVFEYNHDKAQKLAEETGLDAIDDMLKFLQDLFSDCGYPEDPKNYISTAGTFCWFCPALNTMIEATQSLASIVYGKVTGGLIAMLGAFLCVWLALKIMWYIGSMKPYSPGDFFTEIGKIVLRVALAAIALGVGTSLWDYSITPLADIVFDYGTSALSVNVDVKSSAPVDAIGSKLVGSDNASGGIIYAINKKIMEIIASGWVMFTAALKAGDLCIPFGHWGLFLISIVVMLFGIMYLFIIPMKFADVLFRLGVFLVMMPLFVFAWAFPITKDFFKNGVNLLINVMMTLLIFCIVIGICTELIRQEINFPSLDADFEKALKQLVDEFVLSWYKLILIITYMIFSFSIINNVGNIAGRLSQTGYSPSLFAQGSGHQKSTVARVTGGIANKSIAVASAGKNVAKAGHRFYKNRQKLKG